MRRRIPWQIVLVCGLYVAMGAVCGFLTANAEISLPVCLILLAVSFYAQLIVHEAGHLAFGLLTGYRFSSFRIMQFIWVYDGKSVRRGRYKLAGTGGQCLMGPPDLKDGKMPVVLMNLGGALMNLIVSALFVGLYLLFDSGALLLPAVTGLVQALTNGIPMRLGQVDNDGYNALMLRRDRQAVRAFWVQLKISECTAQGMRIRDMPSEWFEMPDREGRKNNLVAALAVFACNRMMDLHDFESAEQTMSRLLCDGSNLAGMYRGLMNVDRIYCRLLRGESTDSLMTKEQKKLMKAMKDFPSVIRSDYAFALLAERDAGKTEKAKKRFEECAAQYPYPGDLETERELMQIAEQEAGKCC